MVIPIGIGSDQFPNYLGRINFFGEHILGTNKIVGPGDSLSSIAEEVGHFWEYLWNHPNNMTLKEERKNPETLVPGDVVHVPDLREKSLSCETAYRNRFRRRGIPVKIAFTVSEQNGDPFTGKAYTLVVGKQEFTGATDGNGYLEHWVATTEKSANLTVVIDEIGLPESLEWEIDIGHLPPYNVLPGLQARLNNLGYVCGNIDNDIGDKTIAALKQFQSDNDLDVTGEMDDVTQNTVRDVHGS